MDIAGTRTLPACVRLGVLAWNPRAPAGEQLVQGIVVEAAGAFSAIARARELGFVGGPVLQIFFVGRVDATRSGLPFRKSERNRPLTRDKLLEIDDRAQHYGMDSFVEIADDESITVDDTAVPNIAGVPFLARYVEGLMHPSVA